jgi:nucleotide-binding universal stress UspA family protein
MLQSILLATDFRPASRDVATAAVRLASAFGSRVTLLHVLEPVPTWPLALQEERELVAQRLGTFSDQLAAQQVVVAESVIAVGPPADTIVRKAQEIDADLILIGAGERSRVEQFSAAPVAEAVLERAPQPVLAVRPGEPAVTFRKILCPVDHSTASRRGLLNAIRLARGFGGELIVLSIVPTVSWLSAAVETGRLTDAQAEHANRWFTECEQFLQGIDFEGVRWTSEVRPGAPPQEIVTAARNHEADVIVMGATGRTGLVRVLLGSVTRRVLRQLPCSLLTVKEEDVVEELFEEDIRTINRLMAEGRQLLVTHSYLAAAAKFRQALARDPFNASAMECLSEALEGLGHHEESVFHRQRALRLRDSFSG